MTEATRGIRRFSRSTQPMSLSAGSSTGNEDATGARSGSSQAIPMNARSRVSSSTTTPQLSERQRWIWENVFLPVANGWTETEVSARLLISRREVSTFLTELAGHLITKPTVRIENERRPDG